MTDFKAFQGMDKMKWIRYWSILQCQKLRKCFYKCKHTVRGVYQRGTGAKCKTFQWSNLEQIKLNNESSVRLKSKV